MTWNDMEWHGMTWNEMEWHEMTWNDMKWHGMTRKDSEWHGLTQNDTKLHGMTRNDTEWHGMTQNDTEWHGTTRNDMKWHEIDYTIGNIVDWKLAPSNSRLMSFPLFTMILIAMITTPNIGKMIWHRNTINQAGYFASWSCGRLKE